MAKTKELKIIDTYEEEIQSIPDKIKTEKDAFAAADLLVKVRSMFTNVDERRKERTAPANETIKIINSDFKKFLEPLKEMESKLKTALEDYNAERIEEDLKRLEQVRKETGDKELMLPIGLKSLPGGEGEIRFRKKYAVSVVDESKIPRKYLVVDTKKIEKEADEKEGELKIAGVEIKPTSSSAIYTK